MQDRVLLLQGPMGPFFSLLAEELESEGHEVFKINLNGGDEAWYKRGGAHRYCGDLSGWPAFLADFIIAHGIARIFLFGDCRPYHMRASRVARELGVAVFVFEEGYVRPDYITLEPGGVNGHSALSQEAADYESSEPLMRDKPLRAGSSFWVVAWCAVLYYLHAWRLRRQFLHYEHHRSLNCLTEAWCWMRSGWRKIYYRIADRPLARRLRKRCRKQYYLVPLQVHCDAQVTHHSRYASIDSFIDEVISSFACSAPVDTELVFKHHPLDRGYHHYGALIRRLARQHGVHKRVRYLHEAHLPALLRYARGTITINSTVGLTSVDHRTPVKVMGRAVYDIPGITNPQPLDAFWQTPGEVNYKLYKSFRLHLVSNLLCNGNFYRRARTNSGATGVVWPFGSLSAASDPDRAALLPLAARTQPDTLAPRAIIGRKSRRSRTIQGTSRIGALTIGSALPSAGVEAVTQDSA